MDKVKDTMKGGWHPKGKDGRKESWRGDFKGINQVAGWVGKGKDSSSKDSGNRVSRPISSLKDPSTFGPPPRRATGTNIGAQTLAEPLNEQEPGDQIEEERPPPREYRADTTGLTTSHLPPPPVRRNGPDSGFSSANPSPGPPKLPPRLPPRQNSTSTITSASRPPRSPAPEQKGYLNQGALDRLGHSGVSVPGFNIGSRGTPLPTQRTSTGSPGQSPAVTTSPGKGTQLSELQSRFSKFSTASMADPPSEGTTFAQKQAAFRTAESFRKDPTSVSVADARSAASTANNFRERHGEQVAQGWKTADAMNKKHGISDRVNNYAGTQQRFAPASKIVTGPTFTTEGKKKPPPPPPPKRPELGIVSKAASRHDDEDTPIQVVFPGATETPRDVDLDLDLLWFAKDQIAFPPPSIAKIKGTTYAMSRSWSRSGPRTHHTVTIAIRWTENLSTTKIRLTWDASNPKVTAKAEQKHYPPPVPLSSQELSVMQKRYGNRIALWCESRFGSQVGNGECWTLAHDALEAIADEGKARGEEPVMVSQGVSHGCCIYAHCTPAPASPSGGLEVIGVGRGDILQFKSAHFVHRDPSNPARITGESWAGAPDHTSVVMKVEGRVLKVLEQNVGGVKRVQEGTVRLDDLVEGEIKIFRPVPATWCPLSADW